MKDLKELTNISRKIQTQLLEGKLSFSEVRYVLSEVQTTFTILQTAQYLQKSEKQRILKEKIRAE